MNITIDYEARVFSEAHRLHEAPGPDAVSVLDEARRLARAAGLRVPDNMALPLAQEIVRRYGPGGQMHRTQTVADASRRLAAIRAELAGGRSRRLAQLRSEVGASQAPAPMPAMPPMIFDPLARRMQPQDWSVGEILCRPRRTS